MTLGHFWMNMPFIGFLCLSHSSSSVSHLGYESGLYLWIECGGRESRCYV